MQVNDGSCLSNMQCVMSSDAEGYDQVLPTAYFSLFLSLSDYVLLCCL